MSSPSSRVAFSNIVAGVCTLLALSALAFVEPAHAQTTVTVSPASATVHAPGGTQQFIATVMTTRRNHTVRWSLSGGGCTGTTCGVLSATSSTSGTPITYTAPRRFPILPPSCSPLPSPTPPDALPLPSL